MIDGRLIALHHIGDEMDPQDFRTNPNGIFLQSYWEQLNQWYPRNGFGKG
jgi:hypothetical protein